MSTDGTAASTPMGRRGPWFAAIWLFFLVDPLRVGWADRDRVSGVVGLVVTLAFAVVYLQLWLRVRRLRAVPLPGASRSGVLGFGVLLALGVAMVLTLGQVGTTASVYLAVTAVLVFPTRVALGLVLLDVALVVVLGETLPGWTSSIGLGFSIGAASVAVYGIQQMLRRNAALVEAQRVNSELAVENERTRFARDLHDILGHSLTVITVKAELANRLLDVDTERARAELVDLERLSRDALADVRRAVSGYRDLTLPAALAQARAALEAAEIDADLPNSTEAVPTHLREVFAWTVLEGVTNVIRHSGARHCRVLLAPDRVEVTDDGEGGCPSDATGHGLLGLRERAVDAGATVVTRTLEPGFSLAVVAS